MAKLIFLVVSIFFVSHVKPTPRDLVEEAEYELIVLKTIVSRTIYLSRDDLKMAEEMFIANSETVLTIANLSIQQESEAISAQLRAIENLANSTGVDISSCTSTREKVLTRLPEETSSSVRRCITDQNTQALSVVLQGTYLIDVHINTVNNLEFQFKQCNGDLLCISPLLTQIELDKVRIPQKIRVEVAAVEDLLINLKLSVQDCSDANVSEYTSEASTVLKEIEDCANSVIG